MTDSTPQLTLPNTYIVIGIGEGHDEPFLEPLMDEKCRIEQAKALKAWLKAQVSTD